MFEIVAPAHGLIHNVSEKQNHLCMEYWMCVYISHDFHASFFSVNNTAVSVNDFLHQNYICAHACTMISYNTYEAVMLTSFQVNNIGPDQILNLHDHTFLVFRSPNISEDTMFVKQWQFSRILTSKPGS